MNKNERGFAGNFTFGIGMDHGILDVYVTLAHMEITVHIQFYELRLRVGNVSAYLLKQM